MLNMTHQQSPTITVPWHLGETAIRLACLPQHLPPLPSGGRVSQATAYRWALNGLHGIRLRRFKIGGSWHTTLEELERWSEAITAAAERAE